MKRNELFRQAKLEVERRRLKAEMLAEKKKQEIYEAVPELVLLEEEKNITGAKAAALAASGNTEEAEKNLERVKQITEEVEGVLKGLKLDKTVFLPAYHCEICKDTGIDKNHTCRCVLEEVRRMRREEINKASPLKLCRFATFSLERYPEYLPETQEYPRRAMENIYRDCVDYAADFGPGSMQLFMYGNTGLGKTHLALSIASEVLDKGYDVIYLSAEAAFSTISSQRFTGNDLLESMLEADLLVLDDLGTEYLDAYTQSCLYELVNGRMRKPTIYTTNIISQDLLLQTYTEKISSRLLGECHRMRFIGNDLRLYK